MLKSSALQGAQWVKDSIDLVKGRPHQWLLIAFAYLLVFLVLPASSMPSLFKVVIVVLGPAVLTLIMVLFREQETERDTELADIVEQLQPRFKQLLTLGGLCVAYSLIIGLLTMKDSETLSALMQNASEDSPDQMLGIVLPIVVKMLLLLTPLVMATWFSPMLVALHRFPVIKAIKSSIAGCLTAAIPLAFAWLFLTLLAGCVMMLAGALIALLSLLLAPLAKVFGALFLVFSFLSVTAIMLALQYLSYRDVFARKFQPDPTPPA